jgi:serine/threonine-protein kinase
MAARFDLDRMEVTGPIVPMRTAVATSMEGSAVYDIAHNGMLVFQMGIGFSTGWQLFSVRESGQAIVLKAPPARYVTPTLSPDGKRLAVADRDGMGAGIAVYDFQREVMVKLTSTPGRNWWPLWTPDGRYIVYTSLGHPDVGLYCIRSDGSAPAFRLTDSAKTQVPYTFTPDGKSVVFGLLDDQGQSHLWRLPLDLSVNPPKVGTPELVKTPGPAFDAAFSPDGRWLAYTSEEHGEQQVIVQPFPIDATGGRWQVSTAGGRFPRWSRSRNELFFMRGNRLFAVAYRASAGAFAVDKPPPGRRERLSSEWD